ncbi:MAG: CBS domain-containing protein [Desulfovibrionales bacterium]|nr:CBS domain-containing protein [Desulfovibrionales bacterium]
MQRFVDVKILKILVGEATQHQGRPLYEAIVSEARQRGMAGASVARGFMGFGASTLLHTAKILRLAEDLPIMVEIVDTPARMADFLPVVEAMVEEGSIVVQDGQAIFHLPLRIRDVMTGNVATVHAATPLPAVVDLLLNREVKAVPVMDGNHVVGIITGGDLLSRAKMPLRLDMQTQLPSDLRQAQSQCPEFSGLTAKDVMTSPARTLNIKTTVLDALKIMARQNIKRLPVTADDGTMLGIVSRTDVLAAIARASAVAERLEILPSGVHATAKDALFPDVPTAAPETPLTSVLEKLIASPLRRVVIVDQDRKILGIVHDWDLLRRFVQQESPDLVSRLMGALTQREAVPPTLEGSARDVMASNVITAKPETPLAEVIQTLVDRKIKRIVVADDDGRLLGIVDRDAVLKALAAQ